MPTYEYSCQDCGQNFESFHSMKDDPLTDCQLCGAKGTVKRKIGLGAGIIFKGSGFYETDFKDKKGSRSGSESSASTSTEKSSEPKEKSVKKTDGAASTSTKTTAAD